MEQLKYTYESNIRDKVFAEQVKILHNNLFTSVPANFVCALIVFISLYHSENRFLASTWFAGVVMVTVVRMTSIYLYRRSPEKARSHLTLFFIGMSFSAALWGVINSIFMPTGDLTHQMVIIVITAGVTAGGIQTLNANLKASLLYQVLIIGPLSIWCFLQDDFIYTLLGITMITYITFMMVTSIRGYKLLETTLTLQYENQALVDKISIANTKLMDHSKALYQQSIKDPLTGLYNRRYLDEVLTRELQLAIREKQSLCVAMLDLDFFKSFNDTNGHGAGDEVLKFIAELMQDIFRGSDICCRFGGEEFLVVLINSDIVSAEIRLDQFREAVKQGRVPFEGEVLPHITVSIGVAEAPAQGFFSKDIIAAADAALYSAKAAGRDRVIRSASLTENLA